MTAEWLFGRQQERQRLTQFLSSRRPFLLYGPAGVGKTQLLRDVISEFQFVLYCADSPTMNLVIRSLAVSLLRLQDGRVCRAFGNEKAIADKSAVSLKGIVMDCLHEGEYSIVLDHLKRPSYAFASAVREILASGSTPVSLVARSTHMEDVGFLQSAYSDRSQKCEIRNFDEVTARRFARDLVQSRGLSCANVSQFLEKLMEFSAGNPGAITTLIDMACQPKYRSEDHIKVVPLYIDFRMGSGASR